MPDPGLILSHLSREYRVPEPRYILGYPLPPRVLATYDESTQTIYFRTINPSIRTIAHEFAHHYLTVKYGYGAVPMRLHEQMAREFEDFIAYLTIQKSSVKMHNRTYNQTQPYLGILILPLIGTVFFGFLTDSIPHPSLPNEENQRRAKHLLTNFLVGSFTGAVLTLITGGAAG